MSETTTALQLCPTRIDGATVLFAHKVNRAQCQDRQRGQYHKCFTCAHNNAYVSAQSAPGAQAQKPKAPVAKKPDRVQVG
ncbi:MAG: hypothetical protein JNL28_14930 [Planctomycetes bacterium]|nr:hypothetical protein [Planctomycetota bacterium]